MEQAVAGTAQADYSRASVYIDKWEQLIAAMGQQALIDVTRRALTLGDVDSTTGWFAKSYTETTIKGIIVPQGSSVSMGTVGVYARTAAALISVDVVREGDEIEAPDSIYYEVEAVRDYYEGDSFMFRVSDLSKLPMWE